MFFAICYIHSTSVTFRKFLDGQELHNTPGSIETNT